MTSFSSNQPASDPPSSKRESISSDKKTPGHGKLLTTGSMVRIALATALLCIIGPFTIPLPISPVPISLVNLIIGIIIYIMEIRQTLVSVLLYLLLGTIGLPVFSGFSGGLGKLLGPTGGYLTGYLFLAAIAGVFLKCFPKKKLLHALGFALGNVFLYLTGTLWLCFQLSLTFPEGLAIGVLPYIPGDVVKIVFTLIIGPVISKRIKKVSH